MDFLDSEDSDESASLTSDDSSTEVVYSDHSTSGEESLFSDFVTDNSLDSTEYSDSASSEVDSDSKGNDFKVKRSQKRQPTKSSVNNHFRVYRLDVSGCKFDYTKLLILLKEETVEIFNDLDLYSFKFSLAVCCVFKREIDDCEECSSENWFRSNCALKINNGDSELLIDTAISDIERQIANLMKQGSGKQ